MKTHEESLKARKAAALERGHVECKNCDHGFVIFKRGEWQCNHCGTKLPGNPHGH